MFRLAVNWHFVVWVSGFYTHLYLECSKSNPYMLPQSWNIHLSCHMNMIFKNFLDVLKELPWYRMFSKTWSTCFWLMLRTHSKYDPNISCYTYVLVMFGSHFSKHRLLATSTGVSYQENKRNVQSPGTLKLFLLSLHTKFVSQRSW